MSSPNKKSAFFYGDDMDVIGAKLCIAVAADSVQRCLSSDVSHEQTGTSALREGMRNFYVISGCLVASLPSWHSDRCRKKHPSGREP